MNQRNVHFKTNVLLKSIIGKDLINDDNIAILELVKNSYDANSPIVNVIFENIKENVDQVSLEFTDNFSKIIIQDFGHGMDLTDIENKWLNIAYSEKKSQKVQNQRQLAGAKGVGRFSCDRLGEYLNLYTRKSNKDYFHVFIDWKEFEIENRQELEIQKINVQLETIPVDEFEEYTGYTPFSQGTILEMSKLRSVWATQSKNTKGEIFWDRRRLIDLRKSLEKLISPNQAFNQNTFTINLSSKEFIEEDSRTDNQFNKVNGPIQNLIFDKLNFTTTSIESTIDESGKIITTRLLAKGKEIFCLVEHNNIFTSLQNVSMVLYYLNTYSKVYFAKQTGMRSVDFGSIYLFINGFRIPPYGNEGDDWLGLEVRKGQGYARHLGTRELVGRIEVTDSSNRFQIISSREGLVRNENYEQLTKGFFNKTLKRLEKYVVEGIDWDKTPFRDDEIEKRIDNSLNWDASQEVYKQDQNEKDKRTLGIIYAIINAKNKDIISLSINEELIESIAEQEHQRAATELGRLFEQIQLNKYNEDEINRILKEKYQNTAQTKEYLDRLRQHLGVFLSPHSISSIARSEKEIADTEYLLEQQVKQINELIFKHRQEEEARLKIELERDRIEAERLRLERELAFEKQRNTYLTATRKTLSNDAEGLIHSVKINSIQINNIITNLLRKVNFGDLKHIDIIKELGNIKFYSDKVFKTASLVTRANFRNDSELQDINIPKYISQYINLYSDIYEKYQLEFEVEDMNANLHKKVSALELSILFDNLISNAEKWSASKIVVKLHNLENGDLKILFADNGLGLSDKFLNNPERIFELGITESNGSGIGLHNVRQILRRMKAEVVFIGNGTILSGATFQMIFRK